MISSCHCQAYTEVNIILINFAVRDKRRAWVDDISTSLHLTCHSAFLEGRRSPATSFPDLQLDGQLCKYMMSQISSDVIDAGSIISFSGRKLKFNANIDASSFCKRQEKNADYLATSFKGVEVQQYRFKIVSFLCIFFQQFFISP